MNQPARDLFDTEFEATTLSLLAETEQHAQAVKTRAIIRKTSTLITRRAKSEAVLAEILQEPLQMGLSYHILSAGDVDSLSFLIRIAAQTPIESLLISTWCMAMPDVQWITDQLDAGRIGHIDFVIGEIFPAQYPDEHLAIAALAQTGRATLKIARNHAKIMAGDSPDGTLHFAIESSANVNTNPRIEQTAIHMSRKLHDYYRDFFAGIKTIDRTSTRHRKPKP